MTAKGSCAICEFIALLGVFVVGEEHCLLSAWILESDWLHCPERIFVVEMLAVLDFGILAHLYRLSPDYVDMALDLAERQTSVAYLAIAEILAPLAKKSLGISCLLYTSDAADEG